MLHPHTALLNLTQTLCRELSYAAQYSKEPADYLRGYRQALLEIDNAITQARRLENNPSSDEPTSLINRAIREWQKESKL